MRIARIEPLILSVPMLLDGPPPKLAGKARTTMETLLVRVETDAGVTGWGEGFGHRILTATRAVLDDIIIPMCIGRDPGEIMALTDELQRNLAAVGRNGPAMYALSAIDIALWDIAGKVAGLPLYRLLGGVEQPRVAAYASLLRHEDPAVVARNVDRVLARGYRQVKLHETTEAAVEAARQATGPDIPLMVDCTWRWTPDEAIRMAGRWRRFDLRWVEEPVFPPDDFEGLARVQAEGGIALAAGENAMLPDFMRMIELGAVTYLQPSVTKVGGVTAMRRVAALADAAGIAVMPHSAYFGSGLLATIHCTAALAPSGVVERYDADFEVNPFHGAIDPDGEGYLAVPQGPGLGVDPDPALIARFRVG